GKRGRFPWKRNAWRGRSRPDLEGVDAALVAQPRRVYRMSNVPRERAVIRQAASGFGTTYGVAPAASRARSERALGWRPVTRSTRWPSRKIRSVGIERIPYAAAVSGVWSMSSLATSARPSNCSAIDSIVGARARQGGHHGAQKSTRIGLAPRLMMAWNVASPSSLTCLVNMVWSPHWGDRPDA